MDLAALGFQWQVRRYLPKPVASVRAKLDGGGMEPTVRLCGYNDTVKATERDNKGN